MIDNPMFTGYDPTQSEREPDYSCPRCEKGLNPDDTVFDWDNGVEQNWICGDCYKDAIFSLSKFERAGMCGESIAYTEQMVDSARNNPGELADILYTDTMTAEDVL